jgi:hypothetical protein
MKSGCENPDATGTKQITALNKKNRFTGECTQGHFSKCFFAPLRKQLLFILML